MPAAVIFHRLRTRFWPVSGAAATGGAVPRPTSLRAALLCCAALSVAAHAVLFDVIDVTTRPGAMGDARRATTPTGAAAAPNAVRMRMITIAPARAPALAATRDEEATPAQAPPAQSDLMDKPASMEKMAALPGLDGYIPRPHLSVAPRPQMPVVLAAPPGQTHMARHVGVLALYIDESGRVHHIVPDEPRLPREHERIAREAFMAAVFTPGQLEGRVVKSRIRIEVVFDNTPLEGAVELASMGQ